MITIKNASLAYQNIPVFTNLQLPLQAGKWTALLGPSGIGKSSLLRLIAGLIEPHETFSGEISNQQGESVQHQIAWMSQTHMLLPWLTAFENILLGFKLRRENKININKATLKANQLLMQAGLTRAKHLYPHQLSGGMCQRVALLRTLLEDKPIVLMDEPFCALDTFTRYQLHELTTELLSGKTVFFVTHDPSDALRLANEIYLLDTDGIKHLASLNTPTPRPPYANEVINLQKTIYEDVTSIRRKVPS